MDSFIKRIMVLCILDRMVCHLTDHNTNKNSMRCEDDGDRDAVNIIINTIEMVESTSDDWN